MSIAVNPWVQKMSGYVPGEQLNDPEVIKLNTNEAPYQPAPGVNAGIQAEIGRGQFNKYPDPTCSELRAAIAERLGVSSDEVIFCNGSDESLRLIVHGLTQPGDSIAMCSPTYTLYSVLADMFGVRVENHEAAGPDYALPRSFIMSDAKIAFLPNPNPPIGTLFSQEELEGLAAARPDRVLVIDEAYVDFAPQDAVAVYKKYPNVVITRTFSKSYALAGLRAGFMVCRPEIAAELNKIKDSYNVNRLTQVAALAAWQAREYYAEQIARVLENRAYLEGELTRRGFVVSSSHGNFVFARVDGAKRIYTGLKERKVLVRYFDMPGLDDGMRITIGTREQLDGLLAAIDAVR